PGAEEPADPARWRACAALRYRRQIRQPIQRMLELVRVAREQLRVLRSEATEREGEGEPQARAGGVGACRAFTQAAADDGEGFLSGAVGIQVTGDGRRATGRKREPSGGLSTRDERPE